MNDDLKKWNELVYKSDVAYLEEEGLEVNEDNLNWLAKEKDRMIQESIVENKRENLSYLNICDELSFIRDDVEKGLLLAKGVCENYFDDNSPDSELCQLAILADFDKNRIYMSMVEDYLTKVNNQLKEFGEKIYLEVRNKH